MNKPRYFLLSAHSLIDFSVGLDGFKGNCLNSKIARCSVKVTEGGRVRELHSVHGAAFEILTDRKDHGVEVAV